MILFGCFFNSLFLVCFLFSARYAPLRVATFLSLINGIILMLLNNHFTFYLSYLGMNYSNVIGYLLIQVFILQFISGILLSCYYSPFYTIAFDSVFYIMIDVKYG